MSAQPQSTPTYTAVCRFCRKPVAQFPILDVPVIGQPNDRAKKVLTILGMHIAKEHTDQYGAGLTLIQDFQAWLILSQYETNDPTINARCEVIRAGMHGLTRKFFLNDAQLRENVVALDSKGQLNAENVIALIKELRDVLTEQGRYGPQLEPQNRLVV